MRNITGKALLVGATAALLPSLVASPASAATATAHYFQECRRNPTYCINGENTYAKGSSTRILDAIGGDRETGVSRNRTYYARWTYTKPGGKSKVGAGWKKAKLTKIDGKYTAYTGWGHTDGKGPKFPKNTVVCVQYKGNSFKVCAKLK